MRIAAGILMTIVGAFLLMLEVVVLSDSAIYGGDLAFGVLMTILAMFSITGGVFCLQRKYWKVCFASALLLFVFSVYFLSAFAILGPEPAPYPPGSSLAPPPYGLILLSVLGIPPLIFVCLRKREWSESKA